MQKNQSTWIGGSKATPYQRAAKKTQEDLSVADHEILAHVAGERTRDVGLPCSLLSHPVHKISQGTPPWRADPLETPNVRLCIHHCQCQTGYPWPAGQGTEQWLHGHPWHTEERRCVLPVVTNRSRLTVDQNLSTHTYLVHMYYMRCMVWVLQYDAISGLSTDWQYSFTVAPHRISSLM